MHGNLDASSAHSDSDIASCALWFAEPAAQDLFDASSLSSPDRARLASRQSWRREREFKVSRALKSFTNAEAHSYSLSHSADHAALLLAPSRIGVGVDLEVLRPRDTLRIARFTFHEQEVRALEAAAEHERDELFYVLWTLKEALGKALKLSLLDALRQCVFRRDMNGWSGTAPTASPWSAQVFRARPGFFLAAAYVGLSAPPPPLQRWDWPPQRAAEWPVIACATAAAGAASAPV
jgi:4'-phosphopantetheinyl transferase